MKKKLTQADLLNYLYVLRSKHQSYEVCFVTDTEDIDADDESWQSKKSMEISFVGVDARVLVNGDWAWQSDYMDSQDIYEFMAYSWDPASEIKYWGMGYTKLLDEYAKLPWQEVIKVELRPSDE